MNVTPKAYLALARRYRPKKFSELIGQDALVRILRNTLRTKRIHHAYMFSGVRGVGKTTTARLLAAAVNCLNSDTSSYEPCGRCESCLAIIANRHIDIIEFDAASHTGIDNIRELIDAIPYRPALAKYKVYVIDEVHMLSDKAFNALLKTLEEPPSNVVFIFATTEARSVPATIISRCLRFELHLVPREVLGKHLLRIATEEGYKIESAALDHIISGAEGSVRDALSLLDQALNLTEGKTLTSELTRSMLGVSDRSQLIILLEELLKGNVKEAVQMVRQLVDRGSDPVLLVKDLMEIVHSLIDSLIQAAPEPTRGVEDAFNRMTKAITVDGALRLWHVLSHGHRQLIYTPLPYQSLDLLLIRLAYSAQLPSIEPYVKQLIHAPVMLAEPSRIDDTPGTSTLPPKSQDHPEPVIVPPPTSVKAEKTTTNGKTSGDDVPNAASDFGDASELFLMLEDPKHAWLKNRIERYFQIIDCHHGYIKARLAKNAPASIVRDVKNALETISGSTWSIVLADDDVAPDTIQNQRDRQKKQDIEALRHDEKVKEIEEKLDFRLRSVD